MEHPVTLWFEDEEYAALQAVAARYRMTPDMRVRTWIAEPMVEARKAFTAEQWERRRKALEADAVLAATVDSAAEAESKDLR